MSSFSVALRSGRHALFALVAVAPMALSAQTTAGRVFNPRVNPANPDLVAYETLIGDRQELHIRRLATGENFSATRSASAAPAGLIGLPGLASSTQVSVFSGDADWRPVTSDGRQWFAYVASDRGAVKLFVNYVDANGELSSRDPIALPTSGSARHPRWSPDGHHLAFVTDSSTLRVFFNLDQAFASPNAPIAPSSRISAAGRGVLFPAWSPTSSYIAYQAERAVRGTRHFAIEVIGVDATLGASRGTPVVLTDDLVDANAFRPSWSPDAHYVAYYVDRAAAGEDASSLDIGVVEVQTQPTTGRILRGELLRGQSRHIAEGVVANVSHGPSWTRMYLGADARPALVYAQRDDARGNPMYVHSLDAWTGMERRDASRVPLASPSTVNHREVSATESNGFVRYAFASVANGGEVLGTSDDSTAHWAKGPAPMARNRAVVAQQAPSAATPSVAAQSPYAANMSAQPSGVVARASEPVPSLASSAAPAVETGFITSGRRPSSMGLAMIFPGAAQLASGRTAPALLLGAASVIGGSLFVYGTAGTRYALGNETNAATPSARELAVQDYHKKRQFQLLGAGTVGVSWLVGVIDAAMHRDGR